MGNQISKQVVQSERAWARLRENSICTQLGPRKRGANSPILKCLKEATAGFFGAQNVI